MPVLEEPGETVTYRFAMVLPESRRILAQRSALGGVLPTVAISRWTRQAEQLQKIARNTWNVTAVLLGLFPSSQGDSILAVAEIVGSYDCANLQDISPHELTELQLTGQQEASLRAILENEDTDDPFGRLGWIEEAICWIESQTHSRVSSKSDIAQLNVGDRFALFRFPTDDGRWYWLKATGEPNTHELAVTAYLSRVCAPYLPELIAIRLEWNAWLMSDAAQPLDALPADPAQLFKLLENVAVSLAEVQMATARCTSGLLEAGAFDQSLDLIEAQCDSLFEYLGEAMRRQTSTKVPPLDTMRLHEVKSILKSVCSRARALGIPDTVVHGDLNCGNILYACGHCQFIDWSEAYVGHPLVSLQHLLLVAKVGNPDLGRPIYRRLKQSFRDTWARTCDPANVELAFSLMPMLALASTLYGRGDWLTSRRRDDPHHQSNVRALARHMDRAARDPELVETLCH